MKNYEGRKFVIISIITTVAVIFLFRLFYLQAIDSNYKQFAEENVLQKQIIYPARGLIYDRNREILVSNETVYDLMVIPAQVQEFDTAAFCEVIDIEIKEFRDRFFSARRYSYYKPSIFLKQISLKTFGELQERLYEFRGFFPRARTNRTYPYKVAPHILGYLGEVTREDIRDNEYYRLGDYIGISGVEKQYEEELRGGKGIRHVLVDVLNREQGSYLEGELDESSVPGRNIRTTVDVELQAYGEQLMQNKIGSIVAIEPATGEILAMVSNPSYDPNLLIGRKRAENYGKLLKDKDKPLFNRTITAMYPPGSTFKPIMALIGLDEGVIGPNTYFECHGGYYMPGLKVGCHSHKSPVNLHFSIETSCNAYYCNVFRAVIDNPKYGKAEEGYKNWRKRLAGFGLGSPLGIDLPNEKGGILYTSEYYNKLYGKGRWKSPTIISLGIGQGEIGVTPLQMANFSAIIANRGYYITPHLVKEVEGTDTFKIPEFEKHHTGIGKDAYERVIAAMYDVVEKGTGRYYGRVEGIDICGKTGTAENPHGKDHSLFIAFAPKDNPKIAIVTIIENSGFGGTWAAPVSTLMIEKYLTDTISRGWIEKKILEADFIHEEEEKEKTPVAIKPAPKPKKPENKPKPVGDTLKTNIFGIPVEEKEKEEKPELKSPVRLQEEEPSIFSLPPEENKPPEEDKKTEDR